MVYTICILKGSFFKKVFLFRKIFLIFPQLQLLNFFLYIYLVLFLKIERVFDTMSKDEIIILFLKKERIFLIRC